MNFRISFFVALLLITALPNHSIAQKNDCLCYGATGYIIVSIPDPDLLVKDSLKWKERIPVIKKFQGQKIKKVLLQLYTDRVIAFLGDGTYIEMNKAAAITQGIMSDPKIDDSLGITINDKGKPVKLAKPIIVYVNKTNIAEINIDSPLYVGITNHIKLKDIKLRNYFVPNWEQNFSKDSTGKEITADFLIPGIYQMELWSNKTGTAVYRYNFTVKRLPADQLKEEPRIMIGDLDNPYTYIDAATFKKQTEINVSKGFKFEAAVVDFSGPPFLNIYVSNLNSTSLASCKVFMDECLPGSQITFNHVQVSDSSGKLYYIPGIRYILEDTSSDVSGTPYSNLLTYPEFKGGDDNLYLYLQKVMAGYQDEFIKDGGHIEVHLDFKILADGSVTDIEDSNLKPANSLARKCLDMIENGPKWIPATYKGRAITGLECKDLNFNLFY